MKRQDFQNDPAQADPPIIVENISFEYHTAAGKVPVLNDVSLRVVDGEWVAVMGASGSGKSTLLLCAAGLLRASAGRINLTGLDVLKASEKQLTELRRDQVGFIFQEFNLVPALSVFQNIALPSMFGGRRRDPEATVDVLKRMGLDGRDSARPAQLSGGEQQRVAIARALVSQPRVIFADEPTGSLDVRTGVRVLDELSELRRLGTAIVMVTHDPTVAARADRVVWLRDGEIVDELAGASANQIATRLAHQKVVES